MKAPKVHRFKRRCRGSSQCEVTRCGLHIHETAPTPVVYHARPVSCKSCNRGSK